MVLPLKSFKVVGDEIQLEILSLPHQEVEFIYPALYLGCACGCFAERMSQK